LPLPITILVEGEEECGSKNLPPFVEAAKAELAADVALVCDTGMWDAKTPAITTAIRGLVYDEVKIKGADRDLHSGMFGGAAQNPIRVLTKILGAIHDDNGRVTIAGFYDGIRELPADVMAQWATLDLTPRSFLGPVGLSVPAGEKDRSLIEQTVVASDLRRQRHLGRLHGRGVEDRDTLGSIRQDIVPPRERPGTPRRSAPRSAPSCAPSSRPICKAEFISHAGAPAIALDWECRNSLPCAVRSPRRGARTPC